jgi:hypothetical protein
MDTSTMEIDKDEATHIHMLAAWEMKDAKPFACVILIEHTKEFTWNENKLKELYYKNRSWLKEFGGTTSYTWFMDNHMVLKTTFIAKDLKRTPEISISVYEKEKDASTMRPLWMDTER